MSVCGVCEREPVQRQAGVFTDGQRSVHERERDVFHGRRQGRVADGVEQNELVARFLIMFCLTGSVNSPPPSLA